MTSSSSLVKREVSFCSCQVSVLSDGCDGPKQFLTQLAKTRSLQLKYDSFFVADIGRIIRLYRDQWSTLLPGIRPFYAVKANNDPVVVGVLARLGAGFDCASKKEIEQVLAVIDPSEAADRIIFANPFKKPSYIRYAADKGVDLMTFDSEAELHNIKTFYPNARTVIRIKPADCTKAEDIRFHRRFGIEASRAAGLLAVAAQLGLNVVGISFHVGNRCNDSSVYGDTIRAAAELFDVAAERFGFRFDLLDIGGGFYGYTNPPVAFDGFAGAIRSAVEEYFGYRSTPVRVIAEPGQYFAMSAFTLAACVIGICSNDGRADVVNNGLNDADDNSNSMSSGSVRHEFVISDGLTGSLAYTDRWLKMKPESLMTTAAVAAPAAAAAAATDTGDAGQIAVSAAVFETTLWGPTCAGGDCVVERCQLPQLGIGDWVTFADTGAYTLVSATEFNGLPLAKRFYVVEERDTAGLFDDY